MPPELHPDFSWRPPPAHSSFLATFDCFCFSISRERYGFEWALFTHRRFFTLCSFPIFFVTTCFYQGHPGSRQFLLEVCRALWRSSKHRPDPSVCLIHNNPPFWYSEEFVLKSYQILSWTTWGKKFGLSAPYSFRTLFACSKSYVKTIKNTLIKTCTAYNRFDETAHQSYFEKAATRKAALRHIK